MENEYEKEFLFSGKKMVYWPLNKNVFMHNLIIIVIYVRFNKYSKCSKNYNETNLAVC